MSIAISPSVQLDSSCHTELCAVLVGGADNSVRLWSMIGHDTEGAALQPAKTYLTKSTPVFHVQFSPRNLLLGSGSFTLGKRGKQ